MLKSTIDTVIHRQNTEGFKAFLDLSEENENLEDRIKIRLGAVYK